MKVAVLFDRFGPYHVARLKAAENYLKLFAIEIFGETSEYQWEKIADTKLKNKTILFEKKENSQASSREIMSAVTHSLSIIKPQIVAINGWYDRAALSALYWCIKNKIPAILMSESAEEDETRTWWKELIKKTIVSQCSTALVGGIRHINYLTKLGMASKNIFTGYDVIDNDYFEREAAQARENRETLRRKLNLPENYFLVVSRFIKKKNLPFLIEAYKRYVDQAKDQAWHLLILGDGPDKEKLKTLASGFFLDDKIYFEGFKQYDLLPMYFGLAKIFVHVSTTEQWGLVVNEAMASGLPVLISEKCGCVPELVQYGVNGYTIDPYDRESLVNFMLSFLNKNERLVSMGTESKKIVSKLNCDAFGKNLYRAAELASKSIFKKPGLITRAIITSLINR